MGKKGSWFSKVKKAFSTESKEITEQKSKNSKKKWFGKQKELLQNPPFGEATTSVSISSHLDNVKFSGVHNKQSKHALSIPAQAAFSEADSKVVCLTSMSRYVGKTKEEVAAIRIQTAFRGHMARKALRALKGLVRLKSMINGQSVQHQATTALHYMQTLAHVQSQIRARRNRMSEENLALKRQLIQKHEKESERMRSFGVADWNDSQQSKEKIKERLVSKKQALIRRERALAYAHSHQTLKNSLKSDQFTFLDLGNPQWGWSWLERWIAARPWENHRISDAERNSTRGSMKSLSARKPSVGEISSAYYTRTEYSSLGGDHNLSHLTVGSLKAKHPMIQSEIRYRRHSSVESLVSIPSAPSYMAPTESVKARSKGN